MKDCKFRSLCQLVGLVLLSMWPALGAAQMPTGTPPKYSPNVPAKITTPDSVETRIGTLRFKDGAYSDASPVRPFLGGCRALLFHGGRGNITNGFVVELNA